MERAAELAQYWPIAGLVVRTPRLELRWPSADDLVALAALAAKGIHEPDFLPFLEPWTRADPGGELQRGVLQWNWRTAGEWKPDAWRYNPVTVVDGEVVGTQGITGEKFAVRRTVVSGSWLGLEHHGKGIGKEMRAAILHLAFEGLGAVRAETGAFEENAPSIGVTKHLGYRPNGDGIVDRDGEPARELLFVLDRDDWSARRRDDIEIAGLEPCLPLFGVQPREADE